MKIQSIAKSSALIGLSICFSVSGYADTAKQVVHAKLKTDSHVSIQNSGLYLPVVKRNSHTEISQISDPSVWVFAPYTMTVGQAVAEILKMTPYELPSDMPEAIVSKLNQPMPKHLMQISGSTPERAIKTLLGFPMEVINHHSNVSGIEDGLSPLKQYKQTQSSHQPYEVVVSLPYLKSGLSKQPTVNDLKQFSKNKALFYRFNSTDKKIGIGSSQKVADALAQNPRGVFFAERGEDLTQTVKRWAEESGYRLVWSNHVKNLRFTASATFFGKFHDVKGDSALDQLLLSVRTEGIYARPKFYSNKVVEIVPMDYSDQLLTTNPNE